MADTITVAEYCKRHNTSTQAVYARIKRGTLKSTVVNGLKMVVDESVADNETINNDITMLLQSIVKEQKKEIKRLHKTIARLEAERFKSIDALLSVITGGDTVKLPSTTEDHVIDVVEKKKKKKKKRKK